MIVPIADPFVRKEAPYCHNTFPFFKFAKPCSVRSEESWISLFELGTHEYRVPPKIISSFCSHLICSIRSGCALKILWFNKSDFVCYLSHLSTMLLRYEKLSTKSTLFPNFLLWTEAITMRKNKNQSSFIILHWLLQARQVSLDSCPSTV